ncbi:NADH-ubiquinone oxidoreductase subunit [Ascobolus immersus RN42]|uniref:NADH-ubiquinone oxidoreductase subunit n=1 Tax=Ascobolus immersus RN42 TaxID=1160509 RepID=A0A3N4I286_ASCIM|nr:NADH-ubiquinone oxidoreductase subunit [Ascobolus immersus RN42]
MSARFAFGKNVKELRFLLSNAGEGSASLRNFLTKSYPVMKKANPETPILIREALDTEPRVWARFELGRETVAQLNGLNEKQIEEKVAGLVKNA